MIGCFDGSNKVYFFLIGDLRIVFEDYFNKWIVLPLDFEIQGYLNRSCAICSERTIDSSLWSCSWIELRYLWACSRIYCNLIQKSWDVKTWFTYSSPRNDDRMLKKYLRSRVRPAEILGGKYLWTSIRSLYLLYRTLTLISS